MEYDFWITVFIGAIGGGIFCPMLVKWVEKKGWIKISRKEENNNSDG